MTDQNEHPADAAQVRKCPQCGEAVAERVGSHGPFLSCSAFPKCRWSASIGGRKRPKLTDAQAKLIHEHVGTALEFVKTVGSLDRAFRLLKAITAIEG